MTPEERARWARRQNQGFIDGCSADLVGSGPEAEHLCPVCEAIERVAVLAIRAAVAEEREAWCKAYDDSHAKLVGLKRYFSFAKDYRCDDCGKRWPEESGFPIDSPDDDRSLSCDCGPIFAPLAALRARGVQP